MKNVILGCVGTAITMYVTLIVLSLYTTYVHQNELDRVLARIMWSTMRNSCCMTDAFGNQEADMKAADNARVRSDFVKELSEALEEHEKVTIQVLACDMKVGILAAEVSECIPLPGGHEKVIRKSRTIILDRREEIP